MLLFLALLVGYVWGYRSGVRDDQRGWWESVRVDSQGNRVFLGLQATPGFDNFFAQRNQVPCKFER